jgi:uncharacterized membrane protein YdjX (TVP38/TMEM64 family)
MKKKILIFILLIILIFVSVKFFHIKDFLTEENLRKVIDKSGLWAPVIFILIYSITPVLFLPGLPLTLFAGFAFGAFWGVIYADIGATIGATLAFLIARYFARDWVEAKVKGTKFENLDKSVGENGWKIVAFTRLIPLFPYNMLNYFFGITKVKFFHYLIPTLFCMLPACIGYVVFGSSIFDVLKGKFTLKFYIGVAFIIFISILPIVYKKIIKK